MKTLILFIGMLIPCLGFMSCNGQTSEKKINNAIIGGGCDGCEMMYVGMPKTIYSEDTSPGWNEKGQKLIVSRTVFQLDGKTPAPNIIMYYWQTDNDGYYSPEKGMDKRAERHGHIRGWVKTDAAGKYTIKTIRPAPYPGQTMPAHIHLSIKEPDVDHEYYVDEINFDDDPLLIPYLKKNPQENRGGSGIVRLLIQRNIHIAEHTIILGLHIPNYPKTIPQSARSGLNIGEDQPSFTPYHAYGPDKGTRTCPVCKYGRYQGILYFTGAKTDWDDIKKWLQFLEQESTKRSQYLKVYFISAGQDPEYRKVLVNLGEELHLKKTALCFVPSFSDKETEVNLNKINPDFKNTFIIYKHRNIVDKYVNLEAGNENFGKISKALDKTQGDYFELPEIPYE
ncbi:intradiol ring-cleavage dioxygenase [Chryseobacterium angstadtii]|uniref:Intradiol ring-cleavage dioxygenase n=1 Tax=Chryseobacterium angstadtii TaxID=558151 RepID=A0A0J7KQE2_9FLAO|nr:intradiol ring-cleavage dioxygenase [Chryseobacterium angstadtii]KMQ59470.1 intradiol ring-cleavage dioxygenase [Chryseobacterium angstadtii]